MDEAVALMMQTEFIGSCNVCGKIGHKGSDCFTLEKNKDEKDVYYKNLKNRNIWNNINNQNNNNQNGNNFRGRWNKQNNNNNSKRQKIEMWQ